MTLNTKSKQALRAKAHNLKPIILIGNKGLTPAVNKEIDQALNDHELIKVKIATEDREEKKLILRDLCEANGAEMVQQIGKIGVIYRKNLEK